jgi:hypothetical protein
MDCTWSQTYRGPSIYAGPSARSFCGHSPLGQYQAVPLKAGDADDVSSKGKLK